MFRFRKSLRKSAWARARVSRNGGRPRSSPGASCSRSTASTRKPRVRQCGSRAQNYRSGRASSRASGEGGVIKIGNVRAMSPDEVEDKILELKKEQFNLCFQWATGQLESSSRVLVVRRDIARLLTISTEGRLGKTIAAKPTAAKHAKE